MEYKPMLFCEGFVAYFEATSCPYTYHPWVIKWWNGWNYADRNARNLL